MNTRTGGCASRQTNRKAARKPDRQKTKRRGERKMNQDQQKGREEEEK